MDGESAREEYEALENGAKKASGAIDRGIDNFIENSAVLNKAVDKLANKIQTNAVNKQKKIEAAKNKINNSKVGNAVNSAKNSKAGKAVGAMADKAKQAGFNPKEAATNAALGMVTGPKMDESKTGGEIINKGEEAVKEVGKAAINGAKAALLADPVAAAELAFQIVKIAIKMLLILLSAVIGIVFFFIAALIHMLGNIISAILFHPSETFDVIAEALNPTKIESFTMEDQYQMLAVAFGDSVMEAYKQLEEEVMQEIDKYDTDDAYNEWYEILEYNKSINKIKYDDVVRRESEANAASDIGMPEDEEKNMVKVYIGGYTGIHTDDEFETYSKKLNRYDKGLYKNGTTTYATGEEPYFDLDRVRDSIQSEAAYAAVSDMAYLVSGYSVSMNENPILDMGEKVRELKYNLTVISYKIDIQQRILQQELDNVAGIFESGKWLQAGKELLSFIFNGEETYFKYSPDLIQQISTSASRWVYEYHQGIETNCFDYTFYYDIDYEDEDGNSHSKTVTVDFARADDIARVSRTSYIRPTASEFDSTAIGKLPSGSKNATITDRSENKSNEIWVNRSGYDLTEKFYDQWTLDIPMEAFDVDRMMKALFETSVYWTEITEYYTDQDATYSFVPGETDGYNPPIIDQASGQDEILNHYGKYIAKWKYAYYDETIDYGDAPAKEVNYEEGDRFENGIDKQPYFQYDEVYIYDCNCSPNYGVISVCPKCGTTGLMLSKDIGADSDEPLGWGERRLSLMTSPLLSDNAYFRFFKQFTGVFGNYIDDLMRDENQQRKQQLMIVMTTTDKLVLDDYTGDQVGGSYGHKYVGDAGEVVLEHTSPDGTVSEYYPITVEDRIFQLKDSALNVLENSEYIQNLLAKSGLTYAERQRLDTLNWKDLLNARQYLYECGCSPSLGTTKNCPTCGKAGRLVFGQQQVDTSVLTEYMKQLVNPDSYTNVTFLDNGDISIGMIGWTGVNATKIVREAINNNPDKYNQLLAANGLTSSEFESNWTVLGKDAFNSSLSKSAIEAVLNGLLYETSSIQNQMFNDRVREVADYLQNQCNITDPATVVLAGSVIIQMPLEEISDIGHKGKLASFNQDVLIGGIRAGTDNSLDTTYDNLKKWIASGNEYCTSRISSSLDGNYDKVKADRESGSLPWIATGVVPENMLEMCQWLIELCNFCAADEARWKTYIHYSQGGTYPRMVNQELFDAMEGFMATGTTPFSSDCSAFIKSIFWKLGYTVPGSSGEWNGNAQYAARTDWANIQQGDVVVWRTSWGGHVELFVGPGPQDSVGFGSAPPKYHHSWSWHDDHYGASTRRYYKVMN